MDADLTHVGFGQQTREHRPHVSLPERRAFGRRIHAGIGSPFFSQRTTPDRQRDLELRRHLRGEHSTRDCQPGKCSFAPAIVLDLLKENRDARGEASSRSNFGTNATTTQRSSVCSSTTQDNSLATQSKSRSTARGQECSATCSARAMRPSVYDALGQRSQSHQMWYGLRVLTAITPLVALGRPDAANLRAGSNWRNLGSPQGRFDARRRIPRQMANYADESFVVRCDTRARLAETLARIVRTLCSTFSRTVSITMRWLSHAR